MNNTIKQTSERILKHPIQDERQSMQTITSVKIVFRLLHYLHMFNFCRLSK